MLRQETPAPAFIALVALTVVSGCGLAGAANDAEVPVLVITPDNGNANPAGYLPPEPRHSPLAEYTQLFVGTDLDEDAQRRQFEAMQIRRENLIAECMAELGFDYIPHLQSVQLEFADHDDWRPYDPNWVAQWGYGIVSSPTSLVTDGPVFGMGGTDFGPNNQMLGELSESERAAWEEALWGEILGDDLNCFSRAWNQAWNEVDISRSEQFTPLMEAINQFQQLLDHDISAADHDWAICVANAGFPGFTRQTEAADSIWMARLEAVNETTRNPNWPGGEPSATNSPLLAELQLREINLALADLQCRNSTDFQTRHNAHLTVLETQFVADHRADLEALRSALEQRD